MALNIASLFNRLYCNQYIDIFKNVAYTITQEYIEDVYTQVNSTGTVPNFKYFIEKSEALSNELNMRAKWMCSEYKEGRGGKGSITLTTSFKRVIKKNVAEYLQVAKTLRNL